MKCTAIQIENLSFPLWEMDAMIIGSGAASLNCAVHLHEWGREDIAIVTEKTGAGTSYNSGSDKQTFYRLSQSGKEPDSPEAMAHALYDGGGMHGDLALIEATLSAQEFYHLIQAGVPFPHNSFGAYVGYKTDHDPRQRATSAGPWTSRQMCQSLFNDVKKRSIRIFDQHDVVALLVRDSRAVGAIAIDKAGLHQENYGLVFFKANHIVLGVGGPGGLYQSSVYPVDHAGGIGLALEIGAVARNLTESQYGLASVRFRWNVSGTYQQVVPRYISTDTGGGGESEFLNDHFPSMSVLSTGIFLKGYQWPFDPGKIADHGSSLIDILVYRETCIKGRRVFMDFRENPRGDRRIGPFSPDRLEKEAYDYLRNSAALLDSPVERLQKMNPQAIELYRKNNIDLWKEPLEIAVCAQHNNGGLAGDLWWESNIRHLYPVGEVNGSHGVYRPGGSALNAGQVGSFRAAQKIAHGHDSHAVSPDGYMITAVEKGAEMLGLLQHFAKNLSTPNTAVAYRREIQIRMSQHAAHIRDLQGIAAAVADAYHQMARFCDQRISSREDIPYLLQNRHLVLAHAAYLQAIRWYLEEGGGSRGSYLVLNPDGERLPDPVGEVWRYKTENMKFRNYVQETVLSAGSRFRSCWKPCRPIPMAEDWFETVWSQYTSGDVFKIEGDI